MFNRQFVPIGRVRVLGEKDRGRVGFTETDSALSLRRSGVRVTSEIECQNVVFISATAGARDTTAVCFDIPAWRFVLTRYPRTSYAGGLGTGAPEIPSCKAWKYSYGHDQEKMIVCHNRNRSRRANSDMSFVVITRKHGA